MKIKKVFSLKMETFTSIDLKIVIYSSKAKWNYKNNRVSFVFSIKFSLFSDSSNIIYFSFYSVFE